MKRKKNTSKNNKFLKIIIVVIILVILFLVLYTKVEKNCKNDETCFNSATSICRPAKLTIEKEGSTFLYKIKGPEKDDCIISIKIQELNPSYPLETVQLLENKEMECSIPKAQLVNSDFTDKESIIDYCEGPLKTAMYELMIKRMYSVLAQNMGPILSEIENVV